MSYKIKYIKEFNLYYKESVLKLGLSIHRPRVVYIDSVLVPKQLANEMDEDELELYLDLQDKYTRSFVGGNNDI